MSSRRSGQTDQHRSLRVGGNILLVIGLALICASVMAGPAERAKFIHDRLAGVPPVPSPAATQAEPLLVQMSSLVAAGNVEAAALLATRTETFYAVTLKTMAAPWTNREQTPFVPLDDYLATFIGVVRDDLDLRRLLWDDIVYVGNATQLPGLC